eukprot:TRINITY_DN8193_c0_g1_i1.p1 TRINITY_DN8193_c0_g1~~TRINITY_DN8193_c0_g1_i1.p1  ORF type:complete len:219 (-),score=75.27 TRINITY_DN8193_c0_g1_i1:713-1369(-)
MRTGKPADNPSHSIAKHDENFKDRIILRALVAESDKLRETVYDELLLTVAESRVVERDVGAWENRTEFCFYKESASSLSSSSSPRDMPAPAARPVAPNGQRSVVVVYVAQEDKEKQQAQLHHQHQHQSSTSLRSPRRRPSQELGRSESETLKLPHIDIAAGIHHSRIAPMSDQARRAPVAAAPAMPHSESFGRRLAHVEPLTRQLHTDNDDDDGEDDE